MTLEQLGQLSKKANSEMQTNWVIYVGLAVLALKFTIEKVQKYLIYPSNFPEGSRTEVDTPTMYNIPYEDVKIDTIDGERLHAYVMVRGPKSPKTIVLLGPNAGNMGHYLPLAKIFYDQMGYNVMTVSYRGYGKSTGSPSEKGLQKDAQALLNYIKTNHDLSTTSIVLYGRSLGGAVATYMATLPGASDIIKGIVLENTFLSVCKLIPIVIPIARPFSWMVTERWDSAERIKLLKPDIPSLWLGGGKDELIPPSHFKELFDLCPSKYKLQKIYPKGTHNDTPMQPGYWQDMHEFLLRKIAPVNV